MVVQLPSAASAPHAKRATQGQDGRIEYSYEIDGAFFDNTFPLQHTRFAVIHGNVNICTYSQFGAVMDLQAMTVRKH
jgi:hypothetical protein